MSCPEFLVGYAQDRQLIAEEWAKWIVETDAKDTAIGIVHCLHGPASDH
jgi:hypothetical protein